MVPSNIISDVCGLAFLPYVTEEIQEIIYTNEALNIDAYMLPEIVIIQQVIFGKIVEGMGCLF